MRILVVEDYPPLRRSLTKGLKEVGHTVDATGDGNEARWFLEEFEFDILVLDLMLPGMDGLSILRWLRKVKKPTRVLILTAKDTVEDKVKGLALGADDYLVKPFAFDELLARIGVLARRLHGRMRPSSRLARWKSILTIARSKRPEISFHSPRRNMPCWNCWFCAGAGF